MNPQEPKSKAETLAHYSEVERQARAAHRTSVLTKVCATTGYAHRVYLVMGAIVDFSDRELLDYCEYTPEFGGSVERFDSGAYVKVHTD